MGWSVHSLAGLLVTMHHAGSGVLMTIVSVTAPKRGLLVVVGFGMKKLGGHYSYRYMMGTTLDCEQYFP